MAKPPTPSADSVATRNGPAPDLIWVTAWHGAILLFEVPTFLGARPIARMRAALSYNLDGYNQRAQIAQFKKLLIERLPNLDYEHTLMFVPSSPQYVFGTRVQIEWREPSTTRRL